MGKASRKKIPPPLKETVPQGPVPIPWKFFAQMFLGCMAATLLLFHSLLDAGYMSDDLLPMYYSQFHPLEWWRPNFTTVDGFAYFRPLASTLYGVLYEIFGLRGSTPYQLCGFALHALNGSTAGLLSWQCWRSKPLALVTALLFSVGLFDNTPLLSFAYFTDTLWVLSALMTLLFYIRGRIGVALFWYVINFLTKDTTIIVMPILVAYEVIMDAGNPGWLARVVKKIWDKQKWLWTVFGLSIAHLLWMKTFLPIGSDFGKLWGPHLLVNFLLGLQHMIPYHFATEHYGQVPVARQVWTAALCLAPIVVMLGILVRKQDPRLRTYLFLTTVFFAAFFPWSFLVNHETPHYNAISIAMAGIMLTHALEYFLGWPWWGMGLVAASALSTHESLPRLYESHHIPFQTRDAKILLQRTKELVPQVKDGHIFVFDKFEGSRGRANGNFWRTHTLAKDFGYRLLYDNQTIKVCDAQNDLFWVHEKLAKVTDSRFNKPGKYREPPEVYDLTPDVPFTAFRYEQGTLTDVTSSFFGRAGAALKLYKTGLDQQRKGDHGQAINAFLAAKDTLGEYFEFYTALSQSFAAVKQFDKAIQVANYARQLSYPIGQVVPTRANAMAWYNLADVCRQAGKFGEAEMALKSAYDIDPRWVIQQGGFEKLEASKRMGASPR